MWFIGVGIPAEVTPSLGCDGGAIREREAVERGLCMAIMESWSRKEEKKDIKGQSMHTYSIKMSLV